MTPRHPIHRKADREIEIIQALQEKILVHDKAIGHACDVGAELDCLISFSLASRSFDYRRPYMTKDNVTDVKRGWYVYIGRTP